MEGSDKPVVFVPAYNEAHNIATVLAKLAGLRAKGVIGHILVIDDGSSDKTSKIAAEHADKVLRFENNHGKAMAFMEAVEYFFKMEPVPKKMIMLDADLKGVNAQQIKKLIEPLGKKRTTRYAKQTFSNDMVIGQRRFTIDQELNGERAFNLQSLRPLLIREDLRKLLLGHQKNRGGYGLETFLNWFYGKSKLSAARKPDNLYPVPRVEFAQTDFEVGPTTSEEMRRGRTYNERANLADEMITMRAKIARRTNLADELRINKNNFWYESLLTPEGKKLKDAFIRRSNFLGAVRKLHEKLKPAIKRPHITVIK